MAERFRETGNAGFRAAPAKPNKDGAGEIVTGMGPDKRSKAWVRIFREHGTLLREFQAYPDDVRYGVRVAVGGVGE